MSRDHGLHVRKLLLLIAVLALSSGQSRAGSPAPAERSQIRATDGFQPCRLIVNQRSTAVSVIDSETVQLSDGSVVRLLGLLGPMPPLSAGQVNWPSEAAAVAALKKLIEGQPVSLAYDRRRTDRYGRKLAHLFVWHNGSRFWVQGELLAHGHAQVDAMPDNTRCLPELLAHEAIARDPPRGLWDLSHYRILRPEPARWLLQNKRNQFVIVAGLVRDVVAVKSRIYINFGKNWRTDFTAALAKRQIKAANLTIDTVLALKGKRVQVRGWIERRNGPYVRIAHPNLIEPLDANPEPRQNTTSDLAQVARQRNSNGTQPLWLRKLTLPTPILNSRRKK